MAFVYLQPWVIGDTEQMMRKVLKLPSYVTKVRTEGRETEHGA